MRDAGFHEALADGHEPVAGVEPDRVDLRIEMDRLRALQPGGVEQGAQQGVADAVAAPRLAHRHAADVAIGGEAPGADRGAVLEPGQDVHAGRVARGVAFQFGRHALFVDEHLVAHPPQVRQGRGMRDHLDPERCGPGVHSPSSSCSR